MYEQNLVNNLIMSAFTISPTNSSKRMENVLSPDFRFELPVVSVKESTRDMIRLQQKYDLSDELFWEIFNIRVLLNKPIDVDSFAHGSYATLRLS